MLKVYGVQPPQMLPGIRLGGVCPHCNEGTRFARTTGSEQCLSENHASELIAGYMCEICLRGVPVRWKIQNFNGMQPVVVEPEMILRVNEPFDFNHVPDVVKKEVNEGLDCLSVNAYNGFAAMCRRAVQSICTYLGTEESTKIQAQINEVAELANLEAETKKVAIEVMLTGHDGAHPHLPDVDADRAAVLLSLIQDLTYQLFTRPGKIKESAALRKAAIDGKK